MFDDTGPSVSDSHLSNYFIYFINKYDTVMTVFQQKLQRTKVDNAEVFFRRGLKSVSLKAGVQQSFSMKGLMSQKKFCIFHLSYYSHVFPKAECILM